MNTKTRPQIRVAAPAISVILKKTVSRSFLAGDDGLGGKVPASERYRGMQREIDLTPYLGEMGGVRTTKSVREPAGGFTLQLADKMNEQQQDSLYGLIEPMDMVEIRFAHNPTAPEVINEYQRLPKYLPLIMRGFVSSVTRSEVMGSDGRPARTVQVAGQDYGKLWQIIQIRYLANFVLGQNLLSFLRFANNYGVQATSYTPNGFIGEAIQQVFNQFTAKMRQSNGQPDSESPVLDVSLYDLIVPDAEVSPFGVNAFNGGTLYQLLAHYGDVGAWNELFIEDREKGVAVVYRPNPLRRPDGAFIQPQSDPFAPPGGTIDSPGLRVIGITGADIVSQQLHRSDENLANYFWVDQPAYQLSTSSVLRLTGGHDTADSYYLEDYRNSAPSLYGLRMMQLQTNQGPRFDGQSENDVRRGQQTMMAWLDQRRQILVEANRDNVIFESGSMLLRGNERLRPGSIVQVARNDLTHEAYAYRVDHLFQPLRGFTTEVHFDRGTNFISRAQKGRGKHSPYLAEMGGEGAYEETINDD